MSLSLLSLLACLPPPPADAELSAEPGLSAAGEALPLPEDLPFPALVRAQPATLVDERGQTLLVLESLGTAVTVTRLLPHRALVECTGCRAPVEGWLQRSALLPLGGVELPEDALREEDELLLWLHASADDAQRAILSHGLVRAEIGRVAPPWYAEGGFEGPIVEVRRVGEGWTVRTAEPPGGGSQASSPPADSEREEAP